MDELRHPDSERGRTRQIRPGLTRSDWGPSDAASLQDATLHLVPSHGEVGMSCTCEVTPIRPDVAVLCDRM